MLNREWLLLKTAKKEEIPIFDFSPRILENIEIWSHTFIPVQPKIITNLEVELTNAVNCKPTILEVVNLEIKYIPNMKVTILENIGEEIENADSEAQPTPATDSY